MYMYIIYYNNFEKASDLEKNVRSKSEVSAGQQIDNQILYLESIFYFLN